MNLNSSAGTASRRSGRRRAIVPRWFRSASSSSGRSTNSTSHFPRRQVHHQEVARPDLLTAEGEVFGRHSLHLAAGSLTADVSTDLNEAPGSLARRAQQAGQVRADVVPDDLPRIVVMLNSLLWTMDPGSEGWRGYVALMLEAITTEGDPLPPAAPLRYGPASSSWPM